MTHDDELNEWEYKLELSKHRWDTIYKIASLIASTIIGPMIVVWVQGYRLETIEGKADRNAAITVTAVEKAADKAAEKAAEKVITKME